MVQQNRGMSIQRILHICLAFIFYERAAGFQMLSCVGKPSASGCRQSAIVHMNLRSTRSKLSTCSSFERATNAVKNVRRRLGIQTADPIMVATNEFHNVSEKAMAELEKSSLNLRHFLSWASVVGPSPRVSPLLEDRYKNIFPILAAAIAAMGPLLFGYALGYTSPCLDSLASENALSSLQSSTFASIINIGAVIAGLVSSRRIETLGRKPVVLIASLLFFLGFTGVFLGGSYPMLLLGRLVTGFAAGVATVATPMYIAEISPRRLRGFLGSFYQLSCTLGILLSYSLGLAVGWREMALVGSMCSLMFAGLSLLFLPESPGWLERKGFSKRANAYAGKLGMQDELSVSEEEEEFVDSPRRSRRSSLLSRWRYELDSIPTNVQRSLILAAGMILLQQLCGINTVIFFSGQILSSAGMASMANLVSFAVALTQVIVTAFSATSVDSMGRKKLLVGSGAGMTLGMALMMLNFSLQGSSAAGGPLLASSMASMGLLIYIASFSFGWGPVPWLMVGELFPSQYRSLASAMSSVLAWGGSFCMTQFFGTLMSSLGQQMIFTGFTVACAFSVLWVLAPSTQFVETMGKSLEEIQAELSE
uniref:Major facilitator superfamily (MFS) profile domain-containing protein n=1 Tax=Guillardia theta TaxID=55529 RepID=A0A7S4KNP7_GUITH|mmetsp:Transcript_27595/g.89889  ORF Transcript_27595/g.89889 Transcript_27595/m.89889 type:complete len:592 (+) Transcript_27595:476-2251(+)